MSDKKQEAKTISEHWMLRLDESKTTTSGSILIFLQRQDKTVKSCILSKEGNGQTTKFHYHLYIQFIDEVKKDTLDKRVKRYFDNRGTTSSIAVCRDVEQSRTYIVKDGNVIYTKGFTDEQLEDYKKRSYQKTKKKQDKFNIMLQKCRASNLRTEDEIIDVVFDMYKGQRMYFNHMKADVIGLHAVLNPKEELENFRNYFQQTHLK